ncbi:MAG: X-Pro dipeptidyl-peptidase, partial [Bacteroidales bacterium]|nr:X-Pro dipeptidyl-peptidase [Bacteroidales bacterium]
YQYDPDKPVPYTQIFHHSSLFYNKEYMVEDQRFASARADVLCYETPAFETNYTIAGPVQIKLYVSTTGSDMDWVVKIIDVFPDTIYRFGQKSVYRNGRIPNVGQRRNYERKIQEKF